MRSIEAILRGKLATARLGVNATCMLPGLIGSGVLLSLALTCTLLLPGPVCAAQAGQSAKDEQPATEDKAGKEDKSAKATELAYGMPLADADALIADNEHWIVAYRIATPSTCEISCRLDLLTDYTLRFYHGECCYIERTSSVDEAEVKRVFDRYAEELGTTDEATESSDKTYIFSRWKERDREVELSATRLVGGGKYELTYLELDIKIDRLARQAQESELEALVPADPLTGQP